MIRLWTCILWMAVAAVAQSSVEQTGYGPAVAYGLTASELATVNISNSPVGATNATGNNLAGARNSTVGNVPGLSYASIAVPVYIQPSPGEYATPESGMMATVPALLPGIQSPSAYSALADPLAPAARHLRGTQNRTPTHLYSNADLQRMEQQSEYAASLPVSTVRVTTNAEAQAAQAVHDRNLGIPSAAEEQPGRNPTE